MCANITMFILLRDKYNENSKNYIKRLNIAIACTQSNAIQLHNPILDFATLRIARNCNTAFANDEDLLSQLGRIILFVDADEKPAQIAFIGYKSRHITR